MVSKKVKRQILSNIPVKLLVISAGFGAQWTSAVLYDLKISNFALTTKECGWIGSVSFFGRMVGPILTTLLIDRIGRTWTLSICALSYFFQWFTLYNFKTVPSIIACRFAFGVTLGVLQSVLPVYMAENYSPRVRGNLMSTAMFGTYLGGFLDIILILYVDYYTAHAIFTIFGFVSVLSTFFLKESPQYLILKSQSEKARQIYYWLNASKSNELEKYFAQMEQNVLEEKSKSSIRSLFQCPYILKSLKIVMIYNSLMFVTGFAAINTFASLMISIEVPHLLNIMMSIFAILPAIGTGFTCIFLDSFKRKTLLYSGCISLILLHIFTAGLYVIHVFYPLPKFPYLIFVCLSVYSTIFSMTLYPIGSCIQGEILPQCAKPLGSALGVSLSSFTAFLLSNYFLQLAERYGMASSFILFAVATFVLLVYVHFEVPETRGKTLLDIQKELKVTENVVEKVQANLI